MSIQALQTQPFIPSFPTFTPRPMVPDATAVSPTFLPDRLTLSGATQPLLAPSFLFAKPTPTAEAPSHASGNVSLAMNPEQAATVGSVTLDLLTQNTYGLPKPIGKNIAERSERIGKTLGNYDVVGLQETFSKETQAIRTGAATAGLHFQAFQPTEKRLTSSGLEILSKYPIVAKDFQPFYYSSHADALAKKGVAFTRLQVPGVGLVDVYDTHYQAEDDHPKSTMMSVMSKFVGLVLPGFEMSYELIRLHDNQVMADFVHKHESGYPTFIMGDLNTTETNPVYRDLLQRLGVQDSFRVLHPNDPGYTMDGELNPLKGGTGKSRLDYILYKSGKDFTVTPLNSQLANNHAIEGMFVSDHFGVHSSFKIERKV